MTDLATKAGADKDVPTNGDAEIDAPEETVESDDVATSGTDVETDVDTTESGAAEVAEADATDEAVEVEDLAPTLTSPVIDATTVLEPADEAPAAALAAAPTAEWAPAEPKPKKRHLGLWIGIPVGIALAGLGVASAILIAPGVSIAGVAVGGMTAGAAADALRERLADTTIVLEGVGGGATITGAELGAVVDAKALAGDAFAAHPLWNITAWNPAPIEAPIAIDDAEATAALRDVAPQAFVDPVDAIIAFDPATGTYVVTPAVLGTGISVDDVHEALSGALASGETTTTLDAAASDVQAVVPTEAAQAGADQVNQMLATAGFYVGEERTVPVDAATAASWLTVGFDDEGTLEIEADAAAIEALVPGLAALVDRAPVNSSAIVNNAGTVLREAQAGANGRTVGDTSSVASDYAAQLETGNAAFELPVTEVPFQSLNVVRLLEVDLSEQRLYLKENDVVVDSWYISSGASIPTQTGHYTINSKLEVQTMRGYEVRGGQRFQDPNWSGPTDANGYAMYETKNVKHPMYFNGDQAFHGVYWHSNWGNRMSHGCVGMPEYRAAQIFEWAPMGAEVWIHH